MGKTLYQMRSDLRLDLKDTSVLLLWSEAELQRCIDKAVSDLSRFLPRQKSYEVTIDTAVTGESFTTPAAADPDYFVDNVTLEGETAGSTLSLAHIAATNPGLLTFLLTDDNNSITSLTVTVKGTDRDGGYIEENFHLSGGKSQTGKKEFGTVMQVIVGYINGSASSADVVDIGTTNAFDVWVQLANKPIKPGSETISGEARDTDYVMDYANGRIKFIEDQMDAGTAYTIAYTKSQIDIDLTPIKHELIRVDRLIYPASDLPQSFVAADVWGDVLTTQGGVSESQTAMSDDKHAIVRYLARHTPPSVDAPGSYPEFLDDTVILAASAYALFIKAAQYEHQVASDLADADVAITKVTGEAIHTLVTTALGRAAALLVATTGEIDAALAKVSTYLSPVDTQNNAADVLAEIHDMETYLRDTIIKLSDGSGALKNAGTALGATATTDIDAATVGATAWLLEGELLINTVNIGDRVPELFREYAAAKVSVANARVSSALGYIREAEARIAFLRTYIEESSGWVRIAETFIAEASQHIAAANAAVNQAAGHLAEIDRLLSEAAQWQASANAHAALADRWRTEAIERRNEAWSIWHDPKQYIGDFALTLPYQPMAYRITAPSTTRI